MSAPKKDISQSLKKIEDPQKISRVVHEAVEGQSLLKVRFGDLGNFDAVWVGLHGELIEFRLKQSYEKNEIYRKIKKDYLDNQLAPPPVTVCVSLKNQSTFLFQTDIQYIALDQWVLERPKVVTQILRRKHFRYQIPRAYEIYVSLPHPRNDRLKIQGVLFDISRGGIGVKAPLHHEKDFTVGKEVSLFSFRLQGSDVNARGTIRSVRRMPPEGSAPAAAFIGIEFGKMIAEDMTVVEAYLDEKLLELESGSMGDWSG